MEPEALDDLMDRLVAEFSDRLHRGEPARREELLAQVPEPHRAGLERCLRVIELGLAPAPARAGDLHPGAELAGYRIEAVIGKGGMAVVYRAEQLELKRSVALKVLRPGLAVEPRHVDRFRREALAIARLRHPHLLEVYDVGEAEGLHFIAMEYVDGPNLARVIEILAGLENPTAEDLGRAAGSPSLAGDELTFEQAFARLLVPVAAALAEAHDLGLIHRDVKPSNILIHRDGRPVLADFGLARDAGDPGLTLTGEPIGTPHYMSPEQVVQTTSPIDVRTDIYSLGVTIYEGLAGRRPFQGETALQVYDAIRAATPTSLRVLAPDRTREAEAVVRRAIARDPAERYRSARDLARDLEALAQGLPTTARAAEGGAVRRALGAMRRVRSGHGFEYRSATELFGLPLVHVCFAPRTHGVKTTAARGWLAIGNIALGAIAIGNVAVGGVALGAALSCGILSLAGALAVGLGLGAAGGCGIGLIAFGGMAVGYAAFGGYAAGYFAIGGYTHGVHVINGMVEDPAARQWFGDHLPWLLNFFENLRRR